MPGLGASLAKGGASLLTYVKHNLKLYLDFKKNRSDTLAFPSEGSTSFDGVNDYIQLSAPFSHTNHSISVWANHSGINENIFSAQNNSSEGIRLFIDDGNRLMYKVNGSEALVTTAYANQWVHFVCTYDGLTMRVYANGAEVKTTSVTGLSVGTTTNARIGATSFEAGGYFEGKLANVGLWSRVLSPEEVQSVMNKSYSQLGSVEKTSLVAWWALDSKAPTTVTSGTAPRSTVFLDSVSSTLGSAVVDTSNFSGWSYDGSSSADGNNHISFPDGGDNYAYTSGVLSASTVYYFTVTADVSGTFYLGENDGVGSVANIGTGTTTGYFFTDSSLGLAPIVRGSAIGTISHIAVYPVTGGNQGMNIGSSVGNEGAITTTSVYGGNAPILPRAIDIAESQAEAIGNGSASFTASNADYVQIADNSIFTGNGGFSVTCWIKFDSISGNTCIIAKHADYGDLDNAGEFYIINDDGACEFVVVDDTNSASKGQIKTSAFAVDTWYHLACTYNGGTPNSSCKIYINGIFQTQSDNATGSGFASINNTTQPLTIGAFADEGEPHDGNISAVGFWQGALTQSQIQSIMESTSYAKIPASVKSTLGAETLTHDFSNGIGVTVPSALSVASGKTTFNGEMVINGGDVSSDYYAIADNVTWDTSKLYKIVVVCSAYTSGAITHQGGSATFGINFGISSSIGGVGTFTNYAVPNQNGSIMLRSLSFIGTLSSISIKEVIHDIVAYYPLDADSSANGVTNDATTGETLGSEEITKSVTDSWAGNDVSVNEASSEQAYSGTQSLKFTTGTGAGAKGVTSNTFTSIQNALYKIDFWVYSPSSEDIDVFAFQGGGAGSSFVETITIATNQWVNVVRYYNEVAGGASSALKFANNTNSVTAYVDNISLKRVTSNTGVLK